MNHNIYTKEIDDWTITWESAGEYRLWCKQEHKSNTETALVVMLNPGSLSGSGENIKKDTTLRILREIFEDTGYNPFIINLFTLATPKPELLFDNWNARDIPNYSIANLPTNDFSAVMYAYGAYELKKKYSEYSQDILQRINLIRDHYSSLPEINVPKAKTNTPKHPMRIQIEGLKDEFKSLISKSYKANKAFKRDAKQHAPLN